MLFEIMAENFPNLIFKKFNLHTQEAEYSPSRINTVTS